MIRILSNESYDVDHNISFIRYGSYQIVTGRCHSENPGQTVALEDLLCGNHQPMGVAILGDSAGAHFSLPVDWLRPYNWTKGGKG